MGRRYLGLVARESFREALWSFLLFIISKLGVVGVMLAALLGMLGIIDRWLFHIAFVIALAWLSLPPLVRWFLARRRQRSRRVLAQQQVGGSYPDAPYHWLIIIDDERFERSRWWNRRSGLVLRVHVSIENLSETPMGAPLLELVSGARSGQEIGVREADEVRASLPRVGGQVLAQFEKVDGWLVAPLEDRFDGGNPGYRIVSDEISGRWRGVERLATEPGRGERKRVAESAAIEREIAAHARWLESEKHECFREESEYEQKLNWKGGYSVTREDDYLRFHRERHRDRTNRIAIYLRHRVGSSYADEFLKATETRSPDLAPLMEAQIDVLTRFTESFRGLALRTSVGQP